jgi:hypothetical protein
MLINLLLFLSLFILDDSIACFSFLILVIRAISWLFGANQDILDDYYYTRYKNAQIRYEQRRKK